MFISNCRVQLGVEFPYKAMGPVFDGVFLYLCDLEPK